ncbi:MAG: hypothetical protein IPL61_26455 [Myxococcales bacterium]|nr:hypothetical protein [Myxococcales bacterium]
MALFDPSSLATAPCSDAPAQELAWFAIRQPAVVRFLERRLWSADGDAFAVALDATCRLHAAVTLHHGLEPVRVDDRLLRDGLEMDPPPSLLAWIETRCRAAPVVLTDAEEAAVARAVAAIAWGFTSGRASGVDERMLG